MNCKFTIIFFILVAFDSFGQNFELIDFEKTNCWGDEYFEKINERIARITQIKHDSLKIDIIVKANCCIGDFANSTFKNDTLFLTYGLYEDPQMTLSDSFVVIDYFEYCLCQCIFNMSFLLKGEYNQNLTIQVNSETFVLSPHKYQVNGIQFETLYSDTINYFDQYGFRQGIHIKLDEKGRLKSRDVYTNDTLLPGSSYRAYFKSGRLNFESVLNSNNSSTIYFYNRKTQIIRTCTYRDFYEYRDCIDDKKTTR